MAQRFHQPQQRQPISLCPGPFSLDEGVSLRTRQSGRVLHSHARALPLAGRKERKNSDGLRVISLQSGESRLIVGVTEEYGEPLLAAWAADGQTLYYVAKGARAWSIQTVPANGGPSLLVHFDDPGRQHTRYGFATDGRTFYFTMGLHERDVWVAELERR